MATLRVTNHLTEGGSEADLFVFTYSRFFLFLFAFCRVFAAGLSSVSEWKVGVLQCQQWCFSANIVRSLLNTLHKLCALHATALRHF